MTRATALKKARHLWGPHAFIEQRKGGTYKGIALPRTAEESKALRDELARMRANDKPVRPDVETWDGNDLVANYREAMSAWSAAHKVWRERESALESICLTHIPFSVGTISENSMFISRHVRGQGYSWDEAFANAKT